MEIKNMKDYMLADISDEDLLTISEVEKKLSEKTNEDIVLIAYQPSNKAET
jgi:precorrin-3B methylase